jgi:hypothetical protein
MVSKIRRLSPGRLSELEATLDRFMEDQEKEERNRAFAAGLSALSDEALNRIWDNPRDAEYDKRSRR